MDKKFVKRFKSCQNSLSALRKTGGESDRGFYIAGWGVIAAALLAVAFFPGIVVWLCGITGIETPSNLIYLFGILILLLISFYQTALLSKQADRITRLTQVLSIEKFYREQKEAGRTDEETTK